MDSHTLRAFEQRKPGGAQLHRCDLDDCKYRASNDGSGFQTHACSSTALWPNPFFGHLSYYFGVKACLGVSGDSTVVASVGG